MNDGGDVYRPVRYSSSQPEFEAKGDTVENIPDLPGDDSNQVRR